MIIRKWEMYNTMKITLGKGNLNTRCLHQKHQEALIELQIYLQDMKNVFFFFNEYGQCLCTTKSNKSA